MDVTITTCEMATKKWKRILNLIKQADQFTDLIEENGTYVASFDISKKASIRKLLELLKLRPSDDDDGGQFVIVVEDNIIENINAFNAMIQCYNKSTLCTDTRKYCALQKRIYFIELIYLTKFIEIDFPCKLLPETTAKSRNAEALAAEIEVIYCPIFKGYVEKGIIDKFEDIKRANIREHCEKLIAIAWSE